MRLMTQYKRRRTAMEAFICVPHDRKRRSESARLVTINLSVVRPQDSLSAALSVNHAGVWRARSGSSSTSPSPLPFTRHNGLTPRTPTIHARRVFTTTFPGCVFITFTPGEGDALVHLSVRLCGPA